MRLIRTFLARAGRFARAQLTALGDDSATNKPSPPRHAERKADKKESGVRVGGGG